MKLEILGHWHHLIPLERGKTKVLNDEGEIKTVDQFPRPCYEGNTGMVLTKIEKIKKDAGRRNHNKRKNRNQNC